MKKIDKYYIEKRKIIDVKISDFKEYNIPKLLCCDIWNVIDLTKKQVLMRVIAQLFCRVLHIIEDIDSSTSKNIAIEIKYSNDIRKDNQTIFNNIYRYLKPASHFTVIKKYKLNILHFPYRFFYFCKYILSFKNISLKNKMFLSAQLMMLKDFQNNLAKNIKFKQYNKMLIFQEHDTISSFIIQTAQKQGVKVISPQHSYPMNRNEDFDQMFFEGFLVDYKLLWNEFIYKQFLSANIDAKRLYIVGNTKLLNIVKNNVPQEKFFNYFGVTLEWPLNINADKNNLCLLEIADKLAQKYDMTYIIKFHPADDINKYNKILSSKYCKGVVDKNMSMSEYGEKVMFSLAHVTGAIIDLICDYRFVFIHKTEDINYPIETNNIYQFTNYAQLDSNFNIWKNNYDYYKQEYKKIVDKYYVKNAKELHDKVIYKILKE